MDEGHVHPVILLSRGIMSLITNIDNIGVFSPQIVFKISISVTTVGESSRVVMQVILLF